MVNSVKRIPARGRRRVINAPYPPLFFETFSLFLGVPRILQNTLPSFLHPSERTWKRYQKCRSEAVVLSSRYNFAPRVDWDEWRREMEEEKRDWDIYGEYMLESRINLNIRQVNS